MCEKKRLELYREDRATGMTYREIAAKHGVSYNSVAQVCCKRMDERFRPITSESCVYPNLRNWMNENMVTRSELARRMFGNAYSNNTNRVSGWLLGEMNPMKQNIDKLMDITGLTYEQLWEKGENNAAD